MALLYHH